MKKQKPSMLEIGPSKLQLPVFFPSISTIKTNLKPIEYVEILNALGAKNKSYLISAYDIFNSSDEQRLELDKALRHSLDNGLTVLLDSGNYESYWKQDQDIWKREYFHKILKDCSYSFSFCYDLQIPPENIHEHVKIIAEGYKKDQANAENPIIPIIHDIPERLPEICKAVAQELNIDFLSIPERRLGDGIFTRALTLRKIRQSLNELDRYVGIHLLGTGNPMSIGIYSIEGADSYDGLEWCQTVVDHDSGFLFHSTQFDFFSAQTTWNELEMPFQAKMLAHNLEFYSFWMEHLRAAINDGTAINFCKANFHSKFFNMCCTTLGWKVKE